MASKIWARIKLRRGLRADLPTLENGGPLGSAELGWAVDDQTLWIGNGSLGEGAPVLGNTQICTVKPVQIANLLGAQLPAAGNFAILAGTSVTNTGSSVITGDVGAVSSIVPGPWTVNGTVHTVDDSATVAALASATAVYNTLSVLPSTVLTGDLGGQTLTPGVYSYSSSAGLTGTLTLDFQNQTNQRIIIITGSTLTTASASVVNVVNSNASNEVFWIVGSSATLGTTASFAGTIIANSNIILATGVSITNGNVISLNSSVMLDTSTLAIPPSAIPVPFLTLPLSNIGSSARINYTLLQSVANGTVNFSSSTSIPGVTGVLGIDATPSQASATIQDITYTAVNPGIAGNNITVAYTTGGIAGSEVVSVTGNAISVQIQSGVSTAADIVTAITNSTGPSASSSVLNTAANFAILAGTSVTNVGASIFTGDIGATSSITGMGTATVTGTVHTVNDAATIQALTDATNAYNTLNVLSSTTLTGDLGGKTLLPGVYSYSSSATLTGTLTLDFQNLSYQKIVIIITGTLTTANASAVNVINSNATNAVYWVISSSATLGSTTAFAGNIIAQTNITLTTDATSANCSVVSLTGSVALDVNTVTISPPSPTASILVTAVANTPTALETAPVSATNLVGGTGYNITALQTLAQIAAYINSVPEPNVIATVVYSAGQYHLQLSDVTGTAIQVSPSSTSALLTALGLTSGTYQPISAQIGTISLVQTGATTVLLNDTNSFNNPIGVTFTSAVVAGRMVLYYTSTGAPSVMKYKTDFWL